MIMQPFEIMHVAHNVHRRITIRVTRILRSDAIANRRVRRTMQAQAILGPGVLSIRRARNVRGMLLKPIETRGLLEFLHYPTLPG